MKSYFEGWYFKHQNDADVLAVIPGRTADSAFIQVITRKRSYNFTYPVSQYHKGADVRVGSSVFSREGIYLDIDQGGIIMRGEAAYKNCTPSKRDIMGPFRFLPMECRHGIVSLCHRVDGDFSIDGESLGFSGGSGYIEKDSGTSFPESYVWLQLGDAKERYCVMVSAATVPFCGIKFLGIIATVLFEGVEYRLCTYNGARASALCGSKLIISAPGLCLEAEMSEKESFELYAPQKGAMSRKIKESAVSKARVRFYADKHRLFDITSELAGYEFVEAPELL